MTSTSCEPVHEYLFHVDNIYYTTTNKIPNIFQNEVYLAHKSTESAITLITFDPLSSLNNNRDTILVLLDMSSAFDTLDHNVLIHRLSAIGITGIALNWFTSYITNRSSSVSINTNSSLPLHNPLCSPGLCPRPTHLQYLPPPHV